MSTQSASQRGPARRVPVYVKTPGGVKPSGKTVKVKKDGKVYKTDQPAFDNLAPHPKPAAVPKPDLVKNNN